MGKQISAELERIMNGRKIYQHTGGAPAVPVTDGAELSTVIAAPILSEGDLLGLVLFISPTPETASGEAEFKLAQASALFLGRHMES